MLRLPNVLLCLLLLPILALGHGAPSNPILSKYYLPPQNSRTMGFIADRYEVKIQDDGGYVVILPQAESPYLLGLAPDAQLLEADMAKALREQVGQDRAGWHNYEKVGEHLRRIVDEYPHLAMLESYGKSMEGRSLYALRLVGKVTLGARPPALAITAATHGDELITVEVVMGLLDELVQGYGKDARITQMVDTHELYFLPVVNPDGYVRMERYCNGIDPNRNYPWPESPNKNPNPAIQGVINFFKIHDIKGSMDYHSTGGMIMYPWAYTYNSIPAADKGEFHQLTQSMAQTNGYRHGPISKVIYVAKGSSADYYYWKLNTKALAIEISRDGSSSLIPSMIQENRESTWRFIESFR